MKWFSFALAAAIAALLAFAYSNTLHAPFVFDDSAAILENQSIRDLSHLREVLSPPSTTGVTVNGRPLVNLSLALNWHFFGAKVEAYHISNFILHLATAVLLFLVCRQLLLRKEVGAPDVKGTVPADLAAVLLAGLWALHPLQTAAVTYTVQRAEILVSLLACLTVLAFLKLENPATCEGPLGRAWAWLWRIVSVTACLAGMATKEVMAALPLLVLLLDVLLNKGSAWACLRRRPGYYASLGATWLLLGWLVLSGGARGGTVGLETGIKPWDYLLTQLYAVAHYLKLAFWPSPLVFDYGGKVLVTDFARVAPGACVLALLVGLALWSFRKRPLLGFSLAAFFALLAPSSSFVPLADTMFEHRFYLPLATVLGALACALPVSWRRPAVFVGLCLLPVLAFATWRRNAVYGSEKSLWEDVVAKAPGNARAHSTLGVILSAEGDQERAVSEYRKSLALDSENAETHTNFGAALARMGRLGEAAAQLEAALRISPNSAFAHNNLATVLAASGRREEAVPHFEAALARDAEAPELHNNFGSLLAGLGRLDEAEEQLKTAIRLNNAYPEAHANLANILARVGRYEESLNHYTAALSLQPGMVEAWYNRASTYVLMARYQEARADYETVLRLEPGHANAREMLRRLDARR